MAKQVAQPPAQQQEAAKGQHVGVDHPHERGFGKAQVRPDGRQCDVHDGRVQHDHQHAQTEHDKGKPAFAFVDAMRHGTAPVGCWQFKTAQRNRDLRSRLQKPCRTPRS